MHDARSPLFHGYIKAISVHPSITLWITERMSGVKRSANTIATHRSAKKKKAVTENLPDSEEATAMTSPCTESSKPSKRMNETQVPQPAETMSEFGPPFDGLYDQDMALELPDTMPLLMRFRYRLLLDKARPEERVEGTPPHLSWLETKYGHLVEKPVWYNRLVKLANTYLQVQPRGERDIKDKTLGELENAVGHLVPYTEGEKEFLQLLEKIKSSSVQLAGEPDLASMRHSKPPTTAQRTRQERVERVPKTLLQEILTSPNSADSTLGEDSEETEASQCLPTEDAILSCFNASQLATPFTPQIRVRMYVFNLVKTLTPSSTLDSLTEPSSTTASTPQE